MPNFQIYISIGLITGGRMCLMVDPSSDGLKGARFPYGFGIPNSSGMYAEGRGCEKCTLQMQWQKCCDFTYLCSRLQHATGHLDSGQFFFSALGRFLKESFFLLCAIEFFQNLVTGSLAVLEAEKCLLVGLLTMELFLLKS